MTTRIHKFLIDRRSGGQVPLNAGCKVLSIQPQGQHIAVWVANDEDQEVRTPVTFSIYQTGDVFPEPGYTTYAGTVQIDHGHYVAHEIY